MNQRRILLLPLLLLVSACSAQKPGADRAPAVAGTFYPASRSDLERTLTELFSRALPSTEVNGTVAVIVPHAGYEYSGVVAASGYNAIDRTKKYDNIFIIGPSHHVAFEGASVYTAGNFLTPLGSVEVNRKLGENLIRDNRAFSSRTDAHEAEHSVEVQVPFLQHMFPGNLRIVPIVVGANSPQTCRSIAGTLRPYLNGKNLFVISSDFSHYPAYDDAIRVDRRTSGAILTGSPDSLIAAMDLNAHAGVENLATSLCGWSAVLTLLYMTSGETRHTYVPIQYKNSGDAHPGERGRVVGYEALAVTEKTTTTAVETSGLSSGEQAALLGIARRTVEEFVLRGSIPTIDPSALPADLRTRCGAFVTLNKNGRLRGCIGRFDDDEPLYRVVQLMAAASASRDDRFGPVTGSEVKELRIEISVLTPMRKIRSIDEFDPARQGIYMRKGGRSGTFLPQVAAETHWSKEELLGRCASEKAGIGWDGWKDAELFVYEAVVFGEPR